LQQRRVEVAIRARLQQVHLQPEIASRRLCLPETQRLTSSRESVDSRPEKHSALRDPVKGALLRILWHGSLPCLAALSGQPPKPEGCAFVRAGSGLAGRQQRAVSSCIEKHVADEIPLATMAQLARLSPYHFCRAFKQTFGMPPIDSTCAVASNGLRHC
jgi:hypothetical protein